MSTAPEPISLSPARSIGRCESFETTVSRWPSSRILRCPVPGRWRTRSSACSGVEHGMRSGVASAGANATHSATASSAPGTSPDGLETPTSASSSRSAWRAISCAQVSTQTSIRATKVSGSTVVGVAPPLVALGVLIALLGGLWIAAGVLAPTYLTSIVFGVAWFAISSVVLGRAVKRRPDLRWWVRGTFLATAALCTAAFAWTSLRDKTVNEAVPVGVPASAAAAKKGGLKKPQNIALASGPFKVADEGSAKGTATVVRRVSGDRVLTLTHFGVNNGADLRVYLVAGGGKDVHDRFDLGGLKGNKGNQKYDVPKEADIGK